MLTITADGRFVDLNDGFVRLHGYAREDGIGRAVSGLNRTGHGQAEERARALEAGFDRHLTKPVDPVVLEALVGSVSRSPD